jgi:hypothetical protein
MEPLKRWILLRTISMPTPRPECLNFGPLKNRGENKIDGFIITHERGISSL